MSLIDLINKKSILWSILRYIKLQLISLFFMEKNKNNPKFMRFKKSIYFNDFNKIRNAVKSL